MLDPLVWRVISHEPAHDYRIFHTRWVNAAHPSTGEVRRFVVLDSTDWVNVIALTRDDRVVLIRQFRVGTSAIELEIPGGMVDPGEEPRAAAERELREETGYVASSWRHLGVVRPNPAIQGNRLHTFLALDAEPRDTPTFDEGEVCETELRPLDEVTTMLRDGTIDHALVINAFTHLMLATGGSLRRP